jgi:Fe2+ or Zn2+ uptake regulation protein
MITQLKQDLKSGGYSLTRPRLTIFSALQGNKPKTMRELIDSLDGIIDRASVYRTVTLFEDLGISTRIQHGWKYRIELSDAYTPHHHHLTCQTCQRVVTFDEPVGFESMIHAIATSSGFIAKTHNLEIYGICPECQSKAVKQRL